MADSGPSAAAPASSAPSTANADYAKEFSKPVGKTDGDVWDKHFGKEAVAKDKSEKSSRRASADGKSDSKHSEASSSKASKESASPSERSSKGSSTSTSKPSESSTKESKDKSPSETASSKSPDTKSASKSATAPASKTDSTTTEQTTDEAEEGKSGAAPASSKAKHRDLFEQAEKATDPSEARRLYKQAMREAFGKVPDAFREETYVAVRKERQEAEAKIKAAAQKNEDRIKEAVERLTPAANVMRALNDAGLGQLSVPMIQRAIHVMQALRAVEDGDYTQLGEVVSRAAGGLPHDEVMKLYTRGVKVSPASSAARRAAEEAARKAEQAQARVQELERQLKAQQEERQVQQTEAEKRAAQEQARNEWLDKIETELDGHPVLKLPRGKERVLKYLITTADKTLRAPKYSFEQAADRIVAHEKRRRAETAHLEDGGEERESAPARTETRARSLGRAETRDGGMRDESPEASFDRIYRKHAQSAGGRRR